MTWVWCMTGVLTGLLCVACLYWRNRALKAERRAQFNLESMEMWQRHACEWSAYIRTLEDDVEDDVEDAPPSAEYVGAEPDIHDAATMFNFASEAFYYRWLAWNPRHD